jgi:hypothetical protein
MNPLDRWSTLGSGNPPSQSLGLTLELHGCALTADQVARTTTRPNHDRRRLRAFKLSFGSELERLNACSRSELVQSAHLVAAHARASVAAAREGATRPAQSRGTKCQRARLYIRALPERIL